MKKFINELRVKIVNFLSPQPELEEDYVDKVIYLLRRDFSTATQNQILISITKKLSELRDLDMRDMEKKYQVLLDDTVSLKQQLIINQK